MFKHPQFWFLAVTLALMIPTWMVVSCQRREAASHHGGKTHAK